MAGHPETFAGNQLVPADAGHGVALCDHAVGGNIRHAVRGVSCAAVVGVFVAVPAPENALREVHAVKAKIALADKIAQIRDSAAGVPVRVLGGFLVNDRFAHGGAEAAPHVDGLVILRNVNVPAHKFGCFHHFCSPSCGVPALSSTSCVFWDWVPK